MFKIVPFCIAAFILLGFYSCKKDKFTSDPDAKLQISQDSVLFDTVFTTIGSSTRNIRIRNRNSQKIKISSIILEGGSTSSFIINVDGSKGTVFKDLELAAHDSMYIFIQVHIDPNSGTSPLIVSDAINFVVNGNQQRVILEAWGQDAYYHYPTAAIYFQDQSYFSYSICDSVKNSFTMNGSEVVWKNDKPHVIYGYCVVDSAQKLRIQAGTRIYLNYKAGLWVFKGGQVQVLGQKGNEVIFQGARREKDYADEPGQWDRIWINEGSDDNIIDYAIIKNGFIGIQTELLGDSIFNKGQLTLTNTKIQNMSMWGLYCLAYKVYAGNNVISNCQEHSLNIQVGGIYKFYHCTFANFWAKNKQREKPTINLNNYTTAQVIPLNVYFGNCIVDGKLANEVGLDLKQDNLFPATYTFSSCYLKSNADLSDANIYKNVRTGTVLNYKDPANYNFETSAEGNIKNFTNAQAKTDAAKFPKDLNNVSRNLNNVTIGAYEN